MARPLSLLTSARVLVRALLLACAILPTTAHASLAGLGQFTSPTPELSTALSRELPGPCEGELCGELEAPQPKTRVRGFELDLYCRLGGEGDLSCGPRQVWLERYDGSASERSVFTGHYFDTETNLYYAKARYFDPELGRFLSQDSYLGELTEPPSLHRYLYAWDRPTYFVDPDGHDVDLAERARQEQARRAALKERAPSFTNDQGGQIVSADGPAVVPNRGATGGAMSEDEVALDPELRRRFAEAKAKGGGTPAPSGQVTEQPTATGDQRIDDVLEGKARTFEALHTFGEAGTKVSELGLGVVTGTAGDVAMATTGVDPVTGEHVSAKWRVFAAAGIIIPGLSGKDLKLATELAEEAARVRRRGVGVARGGEDLRRIEGAWLRGTHGNAGVVPGQVADALRGKQFRDFDDFREQFWKTVAADKGLASEFGSANVARMREGLAPIAHSSQHLGEQRSYILHHRTPIQHGGGVFDLDNIAVVTPRYHKDMLDPTLHYAH